MRAITLLIAHLKSCPGEHLVGFDFSFIRLENPCSHSQVEGNFSTCGRAWKASVGYEEAERCWVISLEQSSLVSISSADRNVNIP